MVMASHIPQPYLELNAADAERLQVANGDTVTVSAGGWQASATARVDGRVPEGVILMPASLGQAVPQGATPVTVSVKQKAAAQKEAIHAN